MVTTVQLHLSDSDIEAIRIWTIPAGVRDHILLTHEMAVATFHPAGNFHDNPDPYAAGSDGNDDRTPSHPDCSDHGCSNGVSAAAYFGHALACPRFDEFEHTGGREYR
jgi:hypothetical protein